MGRRWSQLRRPDGFEGGCLFGAVVQQRGRVPGRAPPGMGALGIVANRTVVVAAQSSRPVRSVADSSLRRIACIQRNWVQDAGMPASASSLRMTGLTTLQAESLLRELPSDQVVIQ